MPFIARRIGGKGGVSAGPPQQHDTTHSPVGLWQLDGDLTDTSGNGNDLSVLSGAEKYTNGPHQANFKALRVEGSDSVWVQDIPALQITDAVTLELLCYPYELATAEQVIVTCVGDPSSETEVNNTLYDLRLRADNQVRALTEKDAGTDINLDSDLMGLTYGEWAHLAFVREASSLGSPEFKLFVNGQLAGSAAADFPTAGGTPAQDLRIGDNGSTNLFFNGAVSSVKVVASALSDAEVLDEAKRTLPSYVRPK